MRVEARRGRARASICARRDVEVAVLDRDRATTFDDDSGGAMNARVGLIAPHAERYTLRVTEHVSWAVDGEYTVEAALAPPSLTHRR